MNQDPMHDQPMRGDDWQPNTAHPGEMYTVEGRIKAVGAFARGLKDQDPRGRGYRTSMQRTGLVFIGLAVVLVAVIALVAAVL